MANQLSVQERKELLRYHGECLSRAFCGIPSPQRADMLHHAERALQLLKSIPKIEFAIE
jgi:hypothetical protein